jgi:hypothetical protein
MSVGMRIADSTHQIIQIRPEDWSGWKYVEFHLSDVNSHWAGANDGVPHFPVEFNTLFILDNTQQSDIQSTIYISSPVVLY